MGRAKMNSAQKIYRDLRRHGRFAPGEARNAVLKVIAIRDRIEMKHSASAVQIENSEAK